MEWFPFDVSQLFTWTNIFAIVLGTFAGMLIGAIPGMGAMLAVVLLFPLTYSMDPLAAILLLLATYQGVEYGGSISAVVLGIPGTPAALVTVFDGNAMAKQNSPGKALAYSLYSSFFGGVVGAVILIFLSEYLAMAALVFAAPEYCLIGLLGLVAISSLSSEDKMKSVISAVLGLMAGTVGMDKFTGAPRFTFGQIELMEGIGIVTLVIGMFAFAELFSMASTELRKTYITDYKGLKTKLTAKEVRGVSKAMGIGSIVGAISGIIPGMGAGTSSWFSYSLAKWRSRNPSTFGKGNPEGIAAPEAANNATVGGALVPLLSLGIPGSPTIALIMGAFIVHGIQPGPSLFKSEADLVYGVLYGFLLTTIAMFIMGKFVTSFFARVLTVPNPILIPIVWAVSIIGAYITRYLPFDLWLALAIGIVSFILIKLQYSLASFILAFILSPIIEENLRRSLLISGGSYDIFVTRPVSVALIGLMLLIMAVSIIKSVRKKRAQGSESLKR